MKKRLKAISSGEYQQGSHQLALNLQDFLQRCGLTSSLGGFWPLKDEVNWTLAWNRPDIELFFPGGQATSMAFYRCEIDEFERRQSDFGVLMKVPPEKAPAGVPQALLVPGLAFDPQGGRLGRGGGYYDRYLAGYRGLKIGLCFDCQVLDQLESEAHDQKVDVLITEQRTLVVGSSDKC